MSRKTSVFEIEVKNFTHRTREIIKIGDFKIRKVKKIKTGQGKLRFLKLK